MQKKKLDIALKYNDLDMFLIGGSMYEIITKDGMGNKVQSVSTMIGGMLKNE